MSQITEKNKILSAFILFSLIGLILRIWISQFGSNFDFGVWQLNLNLFKQGISIYEFGNYTYGTPWIYTLFLLDTISLPIVENNNFVQNIPGTFYRIKIIFFLGLVDISIFYLLYKKYSLKVGLLFFLNPICIIITGYHNQINNYALLFGFLSILLFEKNKFDYKFFLPLVFLGISLSIKHILIFFPLWLAFKEKKVFKKFLIIFIPYSIFILSFFPYIVTELDHVIFKLGSFGMRVDGPFWGMFGPKIVHMYLDLKTLYSLILISLGFLFIKKDIKESFYLYIMAVVAFSSMMYTQYLVIPLIALAVFWNWKYLVYTILTFMVFLVDYDQLNIEYLRDYLDWTLRSTRVSFYPIILILLVGFIEQSLGKKKFYLYIKKSFNFLKNKIKSGLYFN
jgi:hypothetical protein